MKTKHDRFKRLIAVLLVIVTLLQWMPTNILAGTADQKSSDYTPGDVNADGSINALDINLVRRHIAGTYGVKINTLAADVDADGYVTENDVTNLRKYVAGGYDIVLLRGLERFTVKFVTGEGTAIEDMIVLEGTLISTLPKPYWAEHIFVGWCYDAELKQSVQSTDKVTGNLTLYANWLEQVPLDTLESTGFASAVDVDPDFAITVLSSDPDMTAEDVLAALDADDLTDPTAGDIITVSGTTGAFTVKGNGGFKEGYSYRITLLSDKLTFKDEDATARQYNFTVYRDDVMNLTMQSGIKYLPMNTVSSIVNNGVSVDSLDIALYETDGENVILTELSKGTFNYTGDTAVNVGDIVCVYEGEIPTNRTKDTPKSQLGDMAYLEITAVSGNTYTYENAEAEEILFIPDVLPMPKAADTDNDVNTVTVENKYLDYSADLYSYMNLDSQTTVDVGDFFAFYTGDLGMDDTNAAGLTGYGKITKVTDNGNGTTTVTYIVVSWDDVEATMDVYAEEEMSAAELLEGMDTENMESEIEQQALDSGFAEEAALYLASLSLATDNFTALSAGVNLEDYKVTLKEGETVSPEQLKLMSGGNVQVRITDLSVKARVGKNPTHLGSISGTNADEKGITITLDVSVVFIVYSSISGGELEIAITGSFVEEVGVDFGISAEAVWDWAFIIPYISDIKASANIDTMNYTSVSFNATMISKSEDNTSSALDIAAEIKELLKSMANGGEQSDDTQEKLVESYSKLVTTDTDWVRVVDYNIVEVTNNIPLGIPLINVNFTVDFVVEMDAALSVGFDYEYIEGKRHVFTMSIKNRSAYSDTIDLIEKAYQFCFYSMGRINLKAGVEFGFAISVFTPKLGSVGFEAGAGAYINLYGYFFYELHYTESKGKDVSYTGALMIQVGVYLEFGLVAQAGGGRYSARANLFDKSWKLYETGRRDNVLDFVIEQEDVPEIVMKQFVRQVQLPDSFFKMDYLDLLTGEAKTAIYNDWNDPERANDFRNGENYVITITNDKFTYDPKTNTIAVHPDEDDLKLTGEMTITWKKSPMSFSSKAITRTISLYWDNLRDGYMIVPYTNGGSYVPMIIKNYEEKVTAPADPERLGYTFAGWYSDTTFTTPYTFPEIMPAADTSVYAKWEAKTDIPYTVEHYKENFRSGEYELFETESFKGTTDTTVSPETKTYEGYVSPAKAEIKVEADGSATLRYYYNLERHNITFDAGQVDGADVTAETDITYNMKYGATINAPQMAMKGYTFIGWTEDGSTVAAVADTVGTKDLTYTAMWQKNDDTEYRIEYYVQQADGRYTLQHMIKDTTATGKVFTEEYLRSLVIDGTKTADQKFLIENAIVFENMTVKGIVCEQAAVDGNGKTVIKINYGRKKHTLTFDPNYEGAEPIVKEVFYEAEVIAPQNITRTGYTFKGWSVAPVASMPANSLVYKAVWTPNTNTKYKVEHYKEQLDGSYLIADIDNLTGTTDTSVTPAVKNYEGFTAPSEQTVTVKSDGSLVVVYKYTRNSYTITFDAAGGKVTPPSITAKYGESITLPTPEREGYGFKGWLYGSSVFNDATMGAKSLTLTASWEAGKIGYTVNHYQQNVDGNGYSLFKTESNTADMDSNVTPATNVYEGFTAPNATTIIIKANSAENVVDYYYTRNKYIVSWELGIGSADGQSYTEGLVYYGASVTAPVPSKVGYTFKWNSTPVTVMPAKNLTYTAVWTENTYKVTFHANNGKSEEATKDILYTGTLIENCFTCLGYSFVGWSDGINTYSPATALSTLVTQNTTFLHLDAVWEKQKYNIIYENVTDDEHDNPDVYTVEDAVYLSEPERVGYTFKGWFDNPQFEGTAVEGITVGSTDTKIFYACWEENTYTVVLNANDGLGTSFITEPIPYTGNLPTNTFERAGYTFKGWTDGVNTHGDLAAIRDIIGMANDYNQVTLSAVWEVNKYTITYNLGSHAASTTNNNPTEYSAELGADVVLEDLTPKSGFGFGGWYKNPEFTGEKVTTIACTDTTDYVLYAKWEHAGSYSVKETSKSGYKVTYTVTRTIPDGAVPTTETQNVYVRTQNGTAYGTTVEATGQDKYHFIHNYAVLSFGPNDADTKTFVVTEKDPSLANDPPASWQIGGTARTYTVEIYKIENTAGGLTGTVGTKSVTRTMPVATSYQLSKDLFTSTINLTFEDGSTSVTFNTNYFKTVSTNKARLATAFSSVFNNYCNNVGGMTYGYTLSAKVSSFEDKTFTGMGEILMGDSYQSSDTYQRSTRNVGVVTFNEVIVTSNIEAGMGIGAMLCKATVQDPKITVRRVDTAKPVAKSVAPMATTAYKKGDKAYITVIYNEPINSISGTPSLALNSSTIGKYFKDAVYVNKGTGTNTLVFEVTAKKDISADEIQNTINVYLAFRDSGMGGNFNSNIGNLYATVYDILGN